MSALYGDADAILLDPPDHVGTLVETTLDPSGGDSYTFQWIGREDYVKAEAVYQRETLRRKVSIRNPADGDHWTLLATTAEGENTSLNEPTSDKWERDWNYEQKSIWTIADVADEFEKAYRAGGDIAHAARQLRKDIPDLAQGEEIEHDGTILTFDEVLIVASTARMNTAIIEKLFFDLLRGAETYSIPQPVLRRTMTVPANTNFAPSEANVGRFLKSSTLKNEAAGTWYQDKKLGALPLGTGDFWLKQELKSDTSGSDRWTYVQEYWHTIEFSELIYGKAA